MEFETGTRYRGFVVQRVNTVDLMSSRALEFEHEATGLRLLHVSNDDVENLFSITFPTPPPDHTGTPHILEHSVLAGSRKYPAREGIFELIKRSLGTFINAMTAAEHTLYPVSSTVPKDLFNLAEVYWDAVFHPLLTEHTFLREGHRLELASPEDTASDLAIKGIVYSEMRGGYSMPEALIYRALARNLFPDSVYGLDAGGDPDAITALTNHRLKAYHARYYRPGQALIVVYGNLPTERYLDFVADRLAGELPDREAVTFSRQPRFQAPRRVHMRCPAPSADAGRAWLVLGWICGDGTDPRDATELSLLHTLLLGHPGARLRKTILDAKFGDDLALTFLNTKNLESVFCVGVQGADPARADALVELVVAVLQEVASGSIARDAIETACQQLAHATLQIDDWFPIHLLWRLSTQYVLTGEPVTMLRPAEHLRAVRAWALEDPARLGQLARERLLDNPHRLLVVAEGDPEYVSRRDRALAQSLRERKASMSAGDLERLVSEAKEFERLEQQSDRAAFEQLPQLGVIDLPRRPRMIPTLFEREGRLEFLENQVFANGINYLHLDIDLGHVPAEHLAYLGLFTQCLGKLGSRGQSWAEAAARVASCTSGIWGWAQLDAHAVDPSRTLRSLRIITSFLDGRAEQALDVLEHQLFALDFADRTRLGEILLQARAGHRAHFVARAQALGRCHAARPFSPEAWLTDEGHGLPQLRLIERLAAGFAANQTDLMDDTLVKLCALRDAIARTSRFSVSFTGSRGERDTLRRRVTSWAEREPAQTAEPVTWTADGLPRSIGLAAPVDVAFSCYLVRGPHYADAASPALEVAARYYALEHLIEQIRLRGAAYGAFCNPDTFHRYLMFGSYSDPEISRTLGIFRGARDSLQELPWSAGDIERAVLGTAKDSLLPNRPMEATGTALWWHVHGLTDEQRLERYQSLLAVTPSAARHALSTVLEQGAAEASVCVVASREKMRAANAELGEWGLAIEEVFG
jgi:Zn-dependent M16 (insulinase) family peptidase